MFTRVKKIEKNQRKVMVFVPSLPGCLIVAKSARETRYVCDHGYDFRYSKYFSAATAVAMTGNPTKATRLGRNDNITSPPLLSYLEIRYWCDGFPLNRRLFRG